MKVVFIIDSLEGYGAEKSIVEIALRLKMVTPVFVHLYGEGNLKPRLQNSGITVHSLNIQKTYGFKESVQKITAIINKEKPAIIHSTLYRADLVARQIKKKFPEIILVGSFVSNSYGINRYKQLSGISKLKLLSTQFKDRLTANRVDFFVCNSNAIKKTNVRALNISEKKVEVIYRGRCFQDFEVSTSSLLLVKEELKLKDKTVFLNVGRLHRGKGQIELIKAFKEVHNQHPNTILLIAGEGSLRNDLDRLISDLELVNHVYLLGYREDIPLLLALSDFFVFPTYYEGLPGSLVEAIISETPVIASDISENRECFPGDEALFFPPGRVSELTQQMQKALLIKNWSSRTLLAAEYARDKFDIEKVSSDYDNFYQEIFEICRKKNSVGGK